MVIKGIATAILIFLTFTMAGPTVNTAAADGHGYYDGSGGFEEKPVGGFARLAEALSEAMGKFKPSLPPNKKYEVSSQINAILKKMLEHPESLTVDHKTIIGDGEPVLSQIFPG